MLEGARVMRRLLRISAVHQCQCCAARVHACVCRQIRALAWSCLFQKVCAGRPAGRLAGWLSGYVKLAALFFSLLPTRSCQRGLARANARARASTSARSCEGSGRPAPAPDLTRAPAGQRDDGRTAATATVCLSVSGSSARDAPRSTSGQPCRGGGMWPASCPSLSGPSGRSGSALFAGGTVT